MQALTYTVEEAGELLGISRWGAYEAAKRGGIPTIRLGRRLLVPKARLAELLGMADADLPDPNAEEEVA